MGDFATEKKTVLVTGFGPFGNHLINASWVAVQEMEKVGFGNEVDLIVKEIPVEYDMVKSIVPELWKQYKPDLTVHVGVSGIAKELTLEQQAHNDGYDKCDVRGKYPSDNACVSGAPCCIVSKLDMKRVCDSVNKSTCGVEAIVSMDPGRYLCDFIYFTSLNVTSSRTAFIHVPPLNKPYTSRQLGAAIHASIKAMLAQLS